MFLSMLLKLDSAITFPVSVTQVCRPRPLPWHNSPDLIVARDRLETKTFLFQADSAYQRRMSRSIAKRSVSRAAFPGFSESSEAEDVRTLAFRHYISWRIICGASVNYPNDFRGVTKNNRCTASKFGRALRRCALSVNLRIMFRWNTHRLIWTFWFISEYEKALHLRGVHQRCGLTH